MKLVATIKQDLMTRYFAAASLTPGDGFVVTMISLPQDQANWYEWIE
jgi:hypothetical protein